MHPFESVVATSCICPAYAGFFVFLPRWHFGNTTDTKNHKEHNEETPAFTVIYLYPYQKPAVLFCLMTVPLKSR